MGWSAAKKERKGKQNKENLFGVDPNLPTCNFFNIFYLPLIENESGGLGVTDEYGELGDFCELGEMGEFYFHVSKIEMFKEYMLSDQGGHKLGELLQECKF